MMKRSSVLTVKSSKTRTEPWKQLTPRWHTHQLGFFYSNQYADSMTDSKFSPLYAASERGGQATWQRWRDRLLDPVITFLARARISPHALSIIGAVSVVAGFVFAEDTGTPAWFLWGLWIHVLLDALDGPLARRRGVTRGGWLVDLLADEIGIVMTSLYLWQFGITSATAALLYLGLYLCLVVLIVKRQWLGRPYSFVVRPRLLVYLLLTIDTVWNRAILYDGLPILNVILALAVAEGFIVLYRHRQRSSA